MSDTRSAKEATLHSDLEALRIDRGASAGAGRPRRRRRVVLLIVLLLGAGAALIARRVAGRPLPVTVTMAAKSAPGEYTAVPVLSGSGYVVTGERYVSIGVRVPGRIDHYFVEEGQSVHRDDPLVQLDDRDYRAALARTEAGLLVARANSGLADAELARSRTLRSKDFTSQSELDVQINRAAVAHATATQLEAELAQARVNLDYTVLRAPTDGVILAKLKEVGEIAVPGGFAGSGDLIRMANMSDLRTEVDVNESDLNRVRMGQPAEVTPDAYPEARYPAEVVKLYPQVDRQKGTLKIEVRILKPDAKLMPDMSARVTFLEPLPPAEAAKPAVLLPGAAIRRAADNGSYVWIAEGGHARRVAVQLGGNFGEKVRVTGGLNGGEAVITSSDQGLREGAPLLVTG